MIKFNDNFNNLKPSYLFTEIAKRVNDYKAENKNADIIRLGIGDVTRPLVPCVVLAFQNAVLEMGKASTFRGYEDSGRGYPFLREAVQKRYASYGVNIDTDEVFISDGAKSDSGNIGDIFSSDNIVLITDPVYPVYLDTNIMAGRKIITLDSNIENNFKAMPTPDTKGDIVYLCSPNNPTGSVYTHKELKTWVDWANEKGAIIIFDAAYEAFIDPKINPRGGDDFLPSSIFSIDGAKNCAIEICSLSKTAGFTGTRCGYTIIPKEQETIYRLWARRQASKFNGVSYPVQRAAEAVFSPEGLKQISENISYYRENASIITSVFDKHGIFYTGGNHSPYVWFKVDTDSWSFFDKLLKGAGVVGTPGVGFGKNGEGFFRLTAFNTHENTREAMRRFENIM